MSGTTASPAFSRRVFLQRVLLGSTVFAGFPGIGLAREYRGGEGWPWSPGVADIPYHGRETDVFLTMGERAFVDAVTARLIPSDDDGPGAREADVVTFIDRQLAGFYGQAQRWYMQGPWPEDVLPTQGYQTEYPPAELYRVSIAAIDDWCRDNRDGRRFAGLSEDEQDEVLTGIEEEEIEIEGVPLTTFFELVKENAIEGFFADPIYGGNRGMVGWHYVGFPGARYDYRDFIHHNGARIEMPPVSLAGRPEWSSER